jgi:hypothetical protein
MIDITPLFLGLTRESQTVLDDYGAIIRGVRPLNARQQHFLPMEIKKLFHYLADERSTRRAGYLNEPAALTAYTHYYHWWNLVRLTRLFAGLPASVLNIPPNSVCIDLGSGPLTVPAALWLARPELRTRRLTWYCIDRSKAALSLGEDLYLSLAAATNAGQGAAREPWRIVRIQGEAGIAVRQKAQLVTAANMFNEVIQNSPRPPAQLARSAADMLAGYAGEGAAILLAEPGIPPCAWFLSAVRRRLLETGWHMQAPCPHNSGCPMEQGKWCHFVFPASAAPKALRVLSDSAGLSKDRAALSFLLATFGSVPQCGESAPQAPADAGSPLYVRIASDPIALPGSRTGFYGCSSLGLTLLETGAGVSTQRNRVPGLCSGALVSLPVPKMPPLVDRKSGAARVCLG